jgi:type I restriction enzyme S subunit
MPPVVPFQQTKFGPIPGDWNLSTIGEELSFIIGKAHEPYVSDSGRYVVVNSKFISTDGRVKKRCTENLTPARTGDVLMVMSDLPNGRALAKCFLVDEDHKYAVNQRVCIFRSNRHDPRYLRYFLNRNRYFMAFDDGVQQTHLLNDPIKKCPLILPSRAEQTAIAEALTDTDDLIATLERLIAKKRAIKQGMVQQLLTGRTRLPGFRMPWTDVALGDIAQFSKGSGLPKSALTASGSTPCIHYGELFAFYGPEIHHVTSRTNPAGRVVVSADLDVLMPTSDVTPRGLAKASAIHGRGVVLGGDILIIRPEIGRAYGPFLAHVIRHDADQVLQLVRGSTVYHLYASDMRNFTLSLPPAEEQKAIAETLLDSEQEIEALRVRLLKARDIKTGMMQQLLTGRTRLPVGAAS